MQVDPGTLLYKYYPPERASVLEDLLVRFTPLHELNDSYEGRFILEPIEREREAAIADGFRAEWAQVEVFISSTMGALGVLCLSRRADSEVMWAHYASDHQGFVIGVRRDLKPFDGTAFIWSPYRTKIDLTGMQGFGSFRDIEYLNEPYRIAFGADVPFDAFFRKTLDWRYEAEVRIFRSIYDATLVRGHGHKQIHLFEIPCAAFVRIIVGAKARPEVVEAASAVTRRPDLSHVCVDRARLDQRARRMVFDAM